MVFGSGRQHGSSSAVLLPFVRNFPQQRVTHQDTIGGGAAYYRTPPLNLESRGGVFQNGPVATHPLPEDGVRQWAAAWQLVCRVVALRSVRQRQAGGDARQLLGWTVGRAAGEAVGLAG